MSKFFWKKHYCSKSQSQNLKKMVTVKSRESAYLSFQKAYKGEMWCLCTMIFGQKVSKLNSRPVYCTRLYGIQKTLFLINPLNSLLKIWTLCTYKNILLVCMYSTMSLSLANFTIWTDSIIVYAQWARVIHYFHTRMTVSFQSGQRHQI